MEWLPLMLEALGGGLPAVIIIALGWDRHRISQKLNDTQERRIEREKEHANELIRVMETVRTLGGA